ncbi:MAG: hypothetical protein HYT16_04370 [DPANN group archaeon]|nr:hypothetical protein [DPANN group archaeon]
MYAVYKITDLFAYCKMKPPAKALACAGYIVGSSLAALGLYANNGFITIFGGGLASATFAINNVWRLGFIKGLEDVAHENQI